MKSFADATFSYDKRGVNWVVVMKDVQDPTHFTVGIDEDKNVATRKAMEHMRAYRLQLEEREAYLEKLRAWQNGSR